MTTPKLIRDRIPEIIEADGKTCRVEVMNDAAYRAALLDKLVEEAREVQGASPQERVTELADVLEVLGALMLAEGIDEEEVRRVQRARREERGGFARRLRLLGVG